MGIRNLHWYNNNELISYPVDEVASAVADDGKRLPSNVIVDLNLRWPEGYGKRAFLGAVSVTDKLVSVTIQAAVNLDDITSFVPLAVVSVAQPVSPNIQYALTPMSPGVGGWIVFGKGVDEGCRCRFSNPHQSVLVPRAARSYRNLPVSGSGVLFADAPLQGMVRLHTESPLTLSKEQREIDGALRDVLVLRVTDESASQYPVPADALKLLPNQNTNLFKQLAGPCSGRPDSNSCPDPQPIEFINSVGPDCDGTITIEFQGCAMLAELQDICGAILDCSFGLVDACVPPQIPTSAGLLPSEVTPLNIPPLPPPPPPIPPTPTSESVHRPGELPYLDCFAADVAANFVVEEGLWSLVADVDPYVECPGFSESFSTSLPGSAFVYMANSGASRNISVWDSFDPSTLSRRYTTHLKLMNGPLGVLHNGGLVLNRRPSTVTPGRFVYYIVLVDYDSQTLSIQRYNGTNFQTAVSVFVPGIMIGNWYRVVAEVVPSGPGTVNITARLHGFQDAVEVVLGPLTVSNYNPANGFSGLGSDRAMTRFSEFKVEAL